MRTRDDEWCMGTRVRERGDNSEGYLWKVYKGNDEMIVLVEGTDEDETMIDRACGKCTIR